MKKTLLLIISLVVLVQSCDVLLESAVSALEESAPKTLSETDIISGLKKALQIGADSATTRLHKTNGYFQDKAVKILLPPEASIITDNLNKLVSYIPGGENYINSQLSKLEKSLNRAAEDAAKEALPIISSAITSLSITDALDIRKGKVPSSTHTTNTNSFDSLAATHYLEQQTKDDLVHAFSKPINNSLNKQLIGSTSSNDIWSGITNSYNSAAKLYNAIPLINNLPIINTNLGEYATEKAMNGLFIKIGEEEKKVRKDPYKWSITIIRDVFGSIL